MLQNERDYFYKYQSDSKFEIIKNKYNYTIEMTIYEDNRSTRKMLKNRFRGELKRGGRVIFDNLSVQYFILPYLEFDDPAKERDRLNIRKLLKIMVSKHFSHEGENEKRDQLIFDLRHLLKGSVFKDKRPATKKKQIIYNDEDWVGYYDEDWVGYYEDYWAGYNCPENGLTQAEKDYIEEEKI